MRVDQMWEDTMNRLAIRATLLLILGMVLSDRPALAVTAKIGPFSRVDPATSQEATADPGAIWVENEYLKLAVMTCAPHAGQIFSLVYKPTGQELCNPLVFQGYCWDRGLPMGMRMIEGRGEILTQSETQAQARVTYLYSGENEGKTSRLRLAKTYTLDKGASFLLVACKQENVGQTHLVYNPWIKHVGGMSEKCLSGPPRIVLPQGLANLEWNIKPTLNWIVRQSGQENCETAPMVTSLTDYRRIFRQCAWEKPPRYSLETTLARVSLKPGEAFEIPFVLAVTANLGQVGYAAPELAASIEADGELKPGRQGAVTLRIAGAADLGEKRLEGEITTATGELVVKLPNQQAQVRAGKIHVVPYAFTPPGSGVYHINLTAFDRQTPIRLGQSVNSQKTHITLPIVVGPPPAVVVKDWQQENTGFPSRQPRQVKPWRTLISHGTLKAAQVMVPERIFPEDRFVLDEKTQPAAIRLAGGEYECLQFVVEVPEADPMALNATVSAIVSDRGITLEKVQLREQIYLTTEVPSGYMDFPIGQWPDPLFETDWPARIPSAPIARQNVEFIRKCRRRVYWVTVRAQPEAPGGVYRGTVRLALGGKPAGEFPVEVRVNGFALPRQPLLRCSTGMVGWKGLKRNLTVMGLPADEIAGLDKNAMDAYRRLILEYGWTPTMWFGDVKTFETYKDVGRVPSVFPGGSKNKAVEEWLIQNGLIHRAFVYAPFDEHPDGKVPEVAEWARKWKAQSKIPILDCYYGANVQPLFGLVDVWLGQSPKSTWWGKPTPPLGWGELAVQRKKAGDLFYSCNASLIWHVEFIPVQGRGAFWDDFAVGMDGRYVYSTCRWTDDVYQKNWTTGNYMGCAVYPGPRGITTSIRLETLRDGVEDYDYLAILRQTLEARQQAGKAPAEAVKAAETILGDPGLSERVKTVESLHATRNQVADLIEQFLIRGK